MAASRLTHCLDTGALELPATGRIVLIGPSAGEDLSALPAERCQIVQTVAPDHDHWRRAGWDCGVAASGDFAMAIVFLPRARERAEAWIAAACALVPGGSVVVDGAKTDGVESLLKAVKARSAVDGQISKAHGKCFWFAASDSFADWADTGPRRTDDGWWTAPGVFSADAVDPASAALADALPARLGGAVADLGAGWGYLSARVLERADVTRLHAVEADLTALDCAKRNVLDERAMFHWADATRWQPPEPVDCVVTNPPFHTGRRPDPSLGQAFVTQAARILAPAGRLWLVANRHLPYEATLSDHFSKVTEQTGDARFKILSAERPKRTRR